MGVHFPLVNVLISLSLSLSVEEDGLQRENKRLERVIDKMRCVC